MNLCSWCQARLRAGAARLARSLTTACTTNRTTHGISPAITLAHLDTASRFDARIVAMVKRQPDPVPPVRRVHPHRAVQGGDARNLIGPNQMTILVIMSTVSISELKANLSRYLREVRRGGEVQVLDRGAPVARLVPTSASDDAGIRERLIGTGLLRPGRGGAAAILDEPPLALPVSISEALDEDRTDRL